MIFIIMSWIFSVTCCTFVTLYVLVFICSKPAFHTQVDNFGIENYAPKYLEIV